MESTATLLSLASHGDTPARERLFRRYLPVLTHWAHRRLPVAARDLQDTNDIVQVTLLRAFMRLDQFEHRGEGAFLAYLRQILLNAIRDEMRKSVRTNRQTELTDDVPDRSPSPVEDVVGWETLRRYESAVGLLSPEQQEIVFMRVELGFTYQAIAEATGRTSPDAARMMVTRAIMKLEEAMSD